MCKERAETLSKPWFPRVDSPQSRLGGEGARSIRHTSGRGDSLNHMLAGKPTGCVASATVLVKFEWRQICAKIECIYDTLPAVPTEGATTQNQSAPFAARASTH
jgi:hypothetical protein